MQSTYTQHDKGLLIHVLELYDSTTPSFSDLKKGGFTLVGTYVAANFGSKDWSSIANWIKSAHKAGLRTFIFIGVAEVANAKTAVTWTQKAASIGADVVILDELIAKLNAQEKDIRSIIDAGLKVNKKLQFIITEYNYYYFECAYTWTSRYPSVRVANDHYDDKARIDMNVQLGSKYGRRAFTWLIFARGSSDFDCYVHLDDWISYVKGRDTDALFYYIDHGMDWPNQWAKVMSY